VRFERPEAFSDRINQDLRQGRLYGDRAMERKQHGEVVELAAGEFL